MLQTQLRTPYLLSVLIVILATGASAGGLCLKGLYRDNLFVTSAWKGDDLVTLFVVVIVVAFIFTGQLPSIIIKTGHPTSIVFALDLTLLIPFTLVGAIWLLQRKPWGYVLAGISTVKGPAYTLVLTVGSLWAANSGIADASTEIPIWLFLTLFGLIASALLFGNMENAK